MSRDLDYHIADNAEIPACVVYECSTGDTITVLPIECPELAEAIACWLEGEEPR